MSNSYTINQRRQILQQMEQAESRNAQLLQELQQAEQHATQQRGSCSSSLPRLTQT